MRNDNPLSRTTSRRHIAAAYRSGTIGTIILILIIVAVIKSMFN